MRIRIDALDKKTGMAIDEIQTAIEKARNTNCIHIKRAVIGMRGQIQAIEFTDQGGQ